MASNRKLKKTFKKKVEGRPVSFKENHLLTRYIGGFGSKNVIKELRYEK